jgi:hypothetical protein
LVHVAPGSARQWGQNTSIGSVAVNPLSADLAEEGTGGTGAGGTTTTTVTSKVEGTVQVVDAAAGTVPVRQAGRSQVGVKTNAGARV